MYGDKVSQSDQPTPGGDAPVKIAPALAALKNSLDFKFDLFGTINKAIGNWELATITRRLMNPFQTIGRSWRQLSAGQTAGGKGTPFGFASEGASSLRTGFAMAETSLQIAGATGGTEKEDKAAVAVKSRAKFSRKKTTRRSTFSNRFSTRSSR